MCKASVKSSSPANQHATFYRLDAIFVTQPTVSKHRMEQNFDFDSSTKRFLKTFIFRLDALALSVIATATWLAGWLGGCLSQPVLYQND